jgi:ABC-type Fe3+/spermidine/putrescine transport system ATPase subunit
VLLLDEPLSNLDLALREELRGEIAALRARLGTTMIFVTHDQHEALALADQVAVMNKGVIEQLATPEAIYQSPATAWVAGFVGSANVIDGTVEAGRFSVASASVAFDLPPALRDAKGAGTLAVRAEHITLGGEGGTPLRLVARLFLGNAVEYRLQLGEQIVRVVGAPLAGAEVGRDLAVRFSAAHFFAR